MKSLWIKTRVHIMLVLFGVAGTVHAWKTGRESGISEKIGGPGQFRTAIVEWQNYSEKKVVVYLNDGGHGYAFWMKLDSNYLHYSMKPKVFVCNNEDPFDVKAKLELAREWCRDDKEGNDTRIMGGELDWTPPETVPLTDLDEMEWHLIQHDRDCLAQARKDVSDLALERDRLRARLAQYELVER